MEHLDELSIQAEEEKGCLLTEVEMNSLMAKNSRLSAEIMVKMIEIMIWNPTFSMELELMLQESTRLTTEYHRLSCCNMSHP